MAPKTSSLNQSGILNIWGSGDLGIWVDRNGCLIASFYKLCVGFFLGLFCL